VSCTYISNEPCKYGHTWRWVSNNTNYKPDPDYLCDCGKVKYSKRDLAFPRHFIEIQVSNLY